MSIEAPAFVMETKGTDNSFPRFYTKPVKNNFKTEAAGHPVFEDREFVEIHIPGDRNTVVDTLVKPEHKQRWPREYAFFQANQEIPQEGYALEEWASITRSQVEELRFAHVRTVEQLANLSDDQVNKSVSMGGMALRDKAKRHLEALKGNSAAEALAAESARKDAIIETMQQQHDDLLKRVDALMAQKAGAGE